MMKASFVCSLATVAILAVGNQASGSLELSSIKAQRDFDYNFFYEPLVITDDPFDFSDQDYDLLATIDSLSITLTVYDGDTGSGWGDFDRGHWTLGLDGVDTGLLLNGFRNYETDTRTLTQMPVSTQDQILAHLQDGQLVATIIDTEYGDNKVGLCDVTHWAELKLTGQPIPEPSTMVIWSLLGASVAGLAWWRRRRAG